MAKLSEGDLIHELRTAAIGVLVEGIANWELVTGIDLKERGYPEKKRFKVMEAVMGDVISGLFGVMGHQGTSPDGYNDFQKILQQWDLLSYWRIHAFVKRRMASKSPE